MAANCVNPRGPLTLAVVGRVPVDRVWREPVLGGKNRMAAERVVGGFPWGAAKQALALGFRVRVFTVLGDDAAGDFVEDSFQTVGADTSGVRRGSVPTATAEVLVRGD